jgi:hypothetical protein
VLGVVLAVVAAVELVLLARARLTLVLMALFLAGRPELALEALQTVYPASTYVGNIYRCGSS